MRRERYRKIIIAVFIICVAVIIGGLIYMEINQNQSYITSKDNSAEATSYKDAAKLTYNGTDYKYNTDVKSVLFMGIDKKKEMSGETLAGRGGQSDSLMLLVINSKEKTIQIVQISRNTMTDIDIYDISNELFTTTTGQITLQYAYGDGGIRSCQITKDKVSEIFHNIPIRSYLSLNIDGVYSVVDTMGGIPITVPEDYTEIDASFQKGAELILDGTLTERYVRSRDINTYGSNADRMERQKQFIHAFIAQGKNLLEKDSAIIEKIFNAADPYLLTDMDLDTIEDLSSYQIKEEILELPGKEQHGEEFDEFYVDDAELEKLLVQLFYAED